MPRAKLSLQAQANRSLRAQRRKSLDLPVIGSAAKQSPGEYARHSLELLRCARNDIAGRRPASVMERWRGRAASLHRQLLH